MRLLAKLQQIFTAPDSPPRSAEYLQGYESRFANPTTPCPHPAGSEQESDWIHGHNAADNDEAW